VPFATACFKDFAAAVVIHAQTPRERDEIHPREEKILNKRTLAPVIHDNRTRPQRIARLTSTKEFDHASF
jgi:hypothetical protein